MQNKYILLLASFLYKHFFPLYKVLYYSFKRRQDAGEINLLKKCIKPGDALLDIGSNIGFYAEILSDLAGPQGKVHCFEPDKNNFRHLGINTKNRSNIIRNECAVSDKNGSITLYVSDMLNVDHRTYKPESYKDAYEVKTVCMDDYVNGTFRVDVVKMDIQGAELSALKGMKKTIAANPDIKILMEFWPYGFMKSGSSAEKVFRLLQDDYSMNVYRVSNKDTLEKITGEDVQKMKTGFFDNCNILAAKNNKPLA